MKPNYERLAQRLVIDEGVRLKPYTDTTGHLSIGIGRNLADKGLKPSEVRLMFINDIKEAEEELLKAFPWVIGLDPVRQEVLINMSFNMGISVLRQFVNTMTKVRIGDYQGAANNMRKSKWYNQVTSRAERLAKMMETGKPITD